MGNPIESLTFSASSYQYLDKNNCTLLGLEQKFSDEKNSASAFLGTATNFKNDITGVLDLKGSRNYDKNGIINQNLRVRTKLGKESESIQIRYSPLTVNVPVGKSTSLYLNPHYSGQMDLRKDKWTNSIGAFAGVTQKLDKNTSLSVEAQRYNLQDIKDNSKKNWSINAILSYKF